MVRQFFLAVALSIVGLAASAQTEETSGNLVPLPGHSTANGLTVNQAYAVNQALSAAGAGVIISGFNYGYQYNLGNSWTQCTATNQDGSCSWTMTFNPRVDVNVSIRDNNNAQIYGTTHIETGVNTGDRSRDFQYRFNDPRDILTLGNFNYSASTSNNSRIWGMYSQAVYTVNPCVSNPQSSPQCPGYKTYYNIGDDGHAIVPIPFGFPFYGKLFTHSIFFDNGAVSFYTPNQEPQRWGASWPSGGISSNMGSQFYYSIMPLWTDLINYNGAHYTQQSNQHLKYTWENVSQYGNPSSSNTFSLEIRPTGFIGIQYDQIDVSWATTGMVGNAALGEFATYNSQTSWSVNETIAFDCNDPQANNQNCGNGTLAYTNWQISQCTSNPLSFGGLCQTLTPTVWLDYKCSESALYSSTCFGYEAAYTQWQISECTSNPLSFSGLCQTLTPTVWLDYQCFENPLYNEDCDGYDDAYYIQQCTADPLYDSGCDGYGEAYAKKYILAAPLTETSVVESETVVVAQATTAETNEVAAVAAVTEPAPAPTVSASPAAAATAPVSLVAASTPTPAAPAAEKKAEAKTETKTETAAAGGSGESKSKPTTTRQALAQRRLEAAREQAAASAKANPGAVSSQMDSAASMEQQVELQNVVLGAMGFVAGFDAYSRVNLQDAAGYKPFEIYRGQKNVDTPAARGLLGRSDRLHSEMIDSQYKK